MSDQQDDWWNSQGTPPPAPPSQQAPVDPTFAPGAPPAPIDPDSDATVVVPTGHPGAPPQYAPQGPPPPQYGGAQPQYGGAPPQYGGAQPQYGGAPPQYGGAPQQGAPSYGSPQFVHPGGSSSRYRAPGGSITMLVGATIGILGTFLPWVTFGNDSVNGYETYFIGDSFDAVEWVNPGAYVAFTMVLVILVAVIVLAAGRSIATWLISLFAAGLAGLMTLGALSAVGSVLDNNFSAGGLEIGFGIGLCLIGAIIAAVGAFIVAVKRS